jgi:hypothetical protein
MKALKVLFSAVCILFLQGISVGLPAQDSFDAIKKKFSESNNVTKTIEVVSDIYHYSVFVIGNDEPVFNEFMATFNRNRSKAAYFCSKQADGITYSESCGFKDGEDSVLSIYSYDMKDSPNIKIIYVESCVFPQKEIAEQGGDDPKDGKSPESDEQMFENFMEKLQTDTDSKFEVAADGLKAADERMKAADEREKAAAETYESGRRTYESGSRTHESGSRTHESGSRTHESGRRTCKSGR